MEYTWSSHLKNKTEVGAKELAFGFDKITFKSNETSITYSLQKLLLMNEVDMA